jgi:cytochrome b subunit of formate dehydrogenase
MKRPLARTLVSVLFIVGGEAAAQPPAGSRLPAEQNTCVTCHGESALWEGDTLRLFVASDQLAEDVHWKNGVNCHDCHGGDPASFDVPQAHAADEVAVPAGSATTKAPFRPALSQRARSPARLRAQVQVCGNCHQQASTEYLASVHGHGLEHSGLVVTAACTDCHGGHGIYSASDPRSTLHAAKVGTTCAACHQFINERVAQSVHGTLSSGAGEQQSSGAGEQRSSGAEEQQSGGTGEQQSSGAEAQESGSAVGARRKPSCIDCHQGHDLPHPESAAFRLALPDRCGNCHADLTTTYTHSLHGELTELGYLPAAKCSDCHGSHDILSPSEPTSRLSTVNRRQTCAQCHTDVTDNFLDYDPHADPANPRRSAILYWVNLGLTGLLTTVFVVFGAHSVLWLVRSLPHVLKRGRPKYPAPGARAFVRFRPVHRAMHAVLMTSFLGLALTGLPLAYSNYGWAQSISWALGGFASTGLWHRIFGIANFACLVFYVLWFGGLLIVGPKTGVSRFQYIFGPDSPVPNRRDLSDFAKMIRWFVGLGPKPTFERWTYWEKFDLWGASADIVLIGTTGLILWFPNQFCAVLPGQVVNIADLIHGKLALLATGFVFAIHFFSANLRPEKFPMDISILTGLVSEEEMQEERPELMRRWRESGQLEEHVAETPSAYRLLFAMLGGFLGLGLGLALLLGILWALFYRFLGL